MKTKKYFYFAMAFSLLLSACSPSDRKGSMELSTESSEAWDLYQKGYIKGQSGNYFEAMNSFEDAIQKDPEFFMAYCQNAAYYLYFKNIEKFKENAELAIHCQTDLTKAEEILKKALVELLIDPDADVSSYGRELVKIYPNDANAYLYYAFFQTIPGDIDGAIKSYKKAIDLDPENGSICQMLGYAYLEGKRYDDARLAFDKFADLYPGNAFAFESKGDYYMAIKDYENAYSSYEKAYKINNDIASVKEKMEKLSDLVGETK